MGSRQSSEEFWRSALTGQMPGLLWMKRIFKSIPSEPRCKLCLAPFGRPGSLLLRLVGNRPSPLNRRLCTMCIRAMHKQPGGAEVEVTALFADVRGSTGLAERSPAGEFGQLLARFYGAAARVVDRWDGIVDKFVGDEAVALFIPGFSGEEHAARAVGAARDLMRETGNDKDDPWISLGAGVHTGTSYVGTVGEGDAMDFTAVGDTMNITARLMAAAGPGEIVISSAAVAAAGLDITRLEHRSLELRGREELVDAWVESLVSTAAPA